ncbi:hypothetical protein CEXT_553981 [Caerostris extrusa]|uniref:Uncharacterized protein n=1 Tax=Caerostris extrusa TaxID=172846 RepID=A0AAV4PC13_CAEEX|nr:hypothetical protein CEXT_553981 [Caerostris extrusa]
MFGQRSKETGVSCALVKEKENRWITQKGKSKPGYVEFNFFLAVPCVVHVIRGDGSVDRSTKSLLKTWGHPNLSILSAQATRRLAMTHANNTSLHRIVVRAHVQVV